MAQAAVLRQASTPHARGSTRELRDLIGSFVVYPACAGIHLFRVLSYHILVCLPRMRGDPPLSAIIFETTERSTPHARGSTSHRFGCRISFLVYPACAGIHLSMPALALFTTRLPRMRGDPPVSLVLNRMWIVSTPHARGSTSGEGDRTGSDRVYPACAGIHPSYDYGWSIIAGLPRMRGDPPLCGLFVDLKS